MLFETNLSGTVRASEIRSAGMRGRDDRVTPRAAVQDFRVHSKDDAKPAFYASRYASSPSWGPSRPLASVAASTRRPPVSAAVSLSSA